MSFNFGVGGNSPLPAAVSFSSPNGSEKEPDMRSRILTTATLLLALLALAACGVTGDRGMIGYGSSYDQGGGT